MSAFAEPILAAATVADLAAGRTIAFGTAATPAELLVGLAPLEGDEPHPAGRALVRHLCRLLTGAPAAFAIAATAQGKPYFPDAPALRFSISHSGRHIAAAVALGRDVGIDIEAVRPVADALAVAADQFTAAETVALQRCRGAERDLLFLRRWTAREAALKALGVGLAAPPPPGGPMPHLAPLACGDALVGHLALIV